MWTVEPAVAVTVICDGPAGVVVVAEAPWPQPSMAEVNTKAATKPICSSHSLGSLRRRRSRSSPRLPPASIASEATSPGVRSGFVLRAAAFTSVAMVRVEVDVAVPLGVTEVGLNVQVLFAGRPEQARLIA